MTSIIENNIEYITGDINAPITVTGNMSIINKTNDIIINGNPTITNNLLTNGNTLSINGNINTNNATLTSNVDISGNIVGNVNGNIDICGNIIGNVTGEIANNVINVTGNVYTGIYNTNQFNDFTITGNMSSASSTVSGNSSISGNLDCSGNVSIGFNKFNINSSNGNTNIAGLLHVNGSTILNNTLDVLGNTNIYGNIINIGNSTSIVNILGTNNLIETTNLQVTDKLITLNKNGPVGSSNGSGIEIEENNLITGYIKIANDRNSYNVKIPTNNTIYKLALTEQNDDFNISGNNTVAGTLNVSGISTLNNNTNVAGTLNVLGASTLTGNTNIAGTLNVNNKTVITNPDLFISMGGNYILQNTLSSGVASGQLGISSALSGDGLVLAVGASEECAAYVYTRTSKDVPFTPYTSSSVASTRLSSVSSGGFGYSCTLSDDGLVLAVAAPNETSGNGAVYVYTRTSTSVAFTNYSGSSSVSATKLETNVGGGGFGFHCSLSTDGLALAVTSYSEHAVYVYGRASKSVQFINNSPTRLAPGQPWYGFTASALSGDGLTLAIGIDGEHATYVYTRTSTSVAFSNSNTRLSYGNGFFGFSCDLSNDGLTLVVGAYRETTSTGSGAVYIYTRTSTSIPFSNYIGASTLAATRLIASGGGFGVSCALSGDGLTLLIGAFSETPIDGATYIYKRTATNVEFSSSTRIVGNGGNFGRSCAVSADSSTLAVGAHLESSIGVARVYQLPISGYALDIVGNTRISGKVHIANSKFTIDVSGNTGISGNLDCSGNVNVGSNKFTITSNSGNTNVGGTLGVTGASTLSGNTNVGGTLGVTGASTLSGNTNVGGTLGVTGTTTLSSNTNIGGTLGVTGNSTLSGNTNISGTLGVTGNSTLSGNTNISGTLGVTGATTLSGNTTINSSLKVIGDNVIGIGTSNPLGGNYNFRLHAVGNNPIIGLQSGNGYDSIVGMQAYNNGIYLGNFYATGLLPNFFIGNDGNIGIGTTSPSYKLSVIGNSNITGTLGVSSNTNISGTLDVAGITTLSGNTGISGTLNVNGKTSINSPDPPNVGGNYVLQSRLASGVTSGEFGIYTALSGDGLTLAVGAYGENATYVYTRTSKDVSFTAYSSATPSAVAATKLSSSSGGNFGFSCTLSDDGLTLAVGALDELSSTGAVYIYTRTNTSVAFTNYTGSSTVSSTRLTTNVGGGRFGFHCSLSINGLVLAVAAYDERAAYVFTRSASNVIFTNVSPTRLKPGQPWYGFTSSALSGDGLTLVIGIDGENAAYAYTRTSTNEAFSASTRLAYSNGAFGFASEVSNDGLTIVVGAYGESSGTGAAYVYTRSSRSVNFTNYTGSSSVSATRLTVPNGGNFGVSCGLSGDGLTLVVGAHTDTSNAGAVYIYKRTNINVAFSSYTKVTGNGGYFGRSCAVSADSNTIIGGATYELSTGAAYVFQIPVSGYALDIVGNTRVTGNTTVTGTLGVASNKFTVDVSGNTGISGNLDCSGNTIIGGTLGVTGISKLSGNVGIGITSPSFPLEVNGAIVTSNKTGNGGNGVNTVITSGNGSFGTIECTNNLNTGKLPLTLQAYGGNVGIGMTNPNYKLDVNGLFHTNTFPLLLGTATDTTAVRMINSLDSSMTNASSRWICWGKDANNNNSCELQYYHASDYSTQNTMTLGFYNNRVMYIKAGGRVGIQTDNPLYNLDVNGIIRANNEIPLLGTNTNSAHTGTYIDINGYNSVGRALFGVDGTGYAGISTGATLIASWSNHPVIIATNGAANGQASERMRITTGGNVGIGTATPNAPLQFNNDIVLKKLVLFEGYNNNHNFLGFGVDHNTLRYQVNHPNDSHVFFTANDFNTNSSTELMRIKGNGNVGIGTSNPSYKLDITGNARVTNTVRFENGIVCSGGDGTFGGGAWGMKIIDPYGTYYHTINNYFNELQITAKGDSDYWYGDHYGSGYIGMYAGNSGTRLLLIQDGMLYGLPVLTVSGNTVINGFLSYWSDSRIKTNIVDINDDYALSILRQIQPKTYNYIDKLKRGNNSVIGFIAQEIKAILPNAVSIIKDYIPNFYTNCSISLTNTPNILLVSSEIDLSWNSLHDASGNAYLDNSGNACSDASGNKIFNIKIFDLSKNEIICRTTNIIDSKNFLINIIGSKFIDTSGNIILQDEYFLYGQEIDDLNTIDKSAIFTVVTSAVQDIDRKQQQDANDIVVLKQQISSLQTENVSLVNKVTDLESRLSKLEEIINNLNK